MYIKEIIFDIILHSFRVAISNVNMAVLFKLPLREVLIVFFAGLLHDIGKFNIDKRILFKKSSLSGYERDKIIRQHPELSVKIILKYFRILNSNQFCLDTLYLVKNHHNQEIILQDILGSILFFNDIFDALTSKRVYKPKLSRQDAIKSMEVYINKNLYC